MYKLVVPYYYFQERKKKKSRNIMLGMNWYRNANHHLSNDIKKHYHEIVRNQLESFEGDSICKYRIKYRLFYKSKSQDMMNIISVIDKFVQDGLVEFGLVKDDNVQYCKRVVCEVVEQEKVNPRIEIELEEIE